MSLKSITTVNVMYHGRAMPMLMGRLILHDRKIIFEYDTDFLQSGLELSPFKLPLQSGLIECRDNLFEGLFGVFNDSLPDGWGRLLIDRKLMTLGINPASLTRSFKLIQNYLK